MSTPSRTSSRGAGESAPAGPPPPAGACPDFLVTAADLFRAFAAADLRLPLRLDDEHVAVVIDVDGRDVLTVDVNGERPDDQAAAIAELIATTINAAAGFPQPDRPAAQTGGGR